MSNVVMTVDAGACKFKTVITGECDENFDVSLKLEGGCPAVKKLASELTTVNVFEAVATPITENVVFIKCSEMLTHAACPLPVAIVKICEAAGELALKKPVTMIYE
jgi:hypothetical protein